MFDPQRAVLVEGGDALLQRNDFELPSSVVARTKSNIACFAGPSFHELNETPVWFCAIAEKGRPDRAGSIARPESSTRRLMPDNELLDFIFDLSIGPMPPVSSKEQLRRWFDGSHCTLKRGALPTLLALGATLYRWRFHDCMRCLPLAPGATRWLCPSCKARIKTTRLEN